MFTYQSFFFVFKRKISKSLFCFSLTIYACDTGRSRLVVLCMRAKKNPLSEERGKIRD